MDHAEDEKERVEICLVIKYIYPPTLVKLDCYTFSPNLSDDSVIESRSIDTRRI